MSFPVGSERSDAAFATEARAATSGSSPSRSYSRRGDRHLAAAVGCAQCGSRRGCPRRTRDRDLRRDRSRQSRRRREPRRPREGGRTVRDRARSGLVRDACLAGTAHVANRCAAVDHQRGARHAVAPHGLRPRHGYRVHHRRDGLPRPVPRGMARACARDQYAASRKRSISPDVTPLPSGHSARPGTLTPISRCGPVERPTWPQPTCAIGSPAVT